MPRASRLRPSAAHLHSLTGILVSLLVAGPAAAQGGYGSASWSIAGTVDGRYQSGTVCRSTMAAGSDTTGFNCQHAVASYVSTVPLTGSAFAVSHNGVVGARATVGVDSVHLPQFRDGFYSFVTSTAGYSTHFTAYSPGGHALAGVQFTVHVRGSQSAYGTTYGEANGQCFPLATFSSVVQFTPFAGDDPTEGGLYEGLNAGSQDVGCGGAPASNTFDRYVSFIVPLGVGRVGYELTTQAMFNSQYAASVYGPGLSGGVSTLFDHTAGIASAVGVDADGNVVQDATVAFEDPTYVGPLDGPATTTTPEPAPVALLGAGAAALAVARRRLGAFA